MSNCFTVLWIVDVFTHLKDKKIKNIDADLSVGFLLEVIWLRIHIQMINVVPVHCEPRLHILHSVCTH